MRWEEQVWAAIRISCDNQGEIVLAKNNKFHSRTKHIDLRYHFICKAVEYGKIFISYIPTKWEHVGCIHQSTGKVKVSEICQNVGIEEQKRGGAKERKTGETRSLKGGFIPWTPTKNNEPVLTQACPWQWNQRIIRRDTHHTLTHKNTNRCFALEGECLICKFNWFVYTFHLFSFWSLIFKFYLIDFHIT